MWTKKAGVPINTPTTVVLRVPDTCQEQGLESTLLLHAAWAKAVSLWFGVSRL